MARLAVAGVEYEGKCTFQFDRLADEKYGTETDKNGKRTGGLNAIYMGLMQGETKSLLAFWDCALEYLKKKKPTMAEIEEGIEAALEKAMETDEESKGVFQEAFIALEESGFFSLQIKKFWANVEKMGQVDEEQKGALETLLAARQEMQ